MSAKTAKIERDGWRAWLNALFPAAVRDPAPHHEEFWEWAWTIPADARPRPFVAIWPRGGAKSTSAEIACVIVAALALRPYALYVCATQEQADDHVANVAALLESPAVAEYYPALAERAVGKFGNVKGWRRNRLRTASGFTLDALGLDSAARGVKVDDDRPGLIIVDDIDSENDSPLVTEKRIRSLTKKVLPAGAKNLAVLAMQNLVHRDSVFAQLADGRADFLADRHVSGPHPAVCDLTYEIRDGRAIITGGIPTWNGQDLHRCQEMVDDFGLMGFLSEAQHEVNGYLGGYFKREWFPIVDAPPAVARRVRRWDLAATEPSSSNRDPDYTRGVLLSRTADGQFTVEDMVSVRGTPGTVESLVTQTAAMDGKGVMIRIEQEPGSSGKVVIDGYVRALAGYDVAGVRSTGSKEDRAKPVSSQAQVSNIRLVRGPWNREWLDEHEAFPTGPHDDIVDATSGGFADLTVPKHSPVALAANTLRPLPTRR